MNHKERAFDVAAEWMGTYAVQMSASAFAGLVTQIELERKNAWQEGWVAVKPGVYAPAATGTPSAEDSALAEALWNLADRWESMRRESRIALGRLGVDAFVAKAETETKIALYGDAANALARLLGSHAILRPLGETE